MVLLLTGGAGFVGHHLVEGVLKQTDWEVVVLDTLTYAGNLNRLRDLECYEEHRERLRVVYHNLRSAFPSQVHDQIGKVDVVWHLAAHSHVDRSLIDAQPFAESAVVGTTNLLQYLREHQKGLRRYIGFNTDEVFGPALPGVYHRETAKFYPSNPYSASKAGQWSMEFAFAHSFNMPISIVHSMNIIGERQNPEKFVPLVVKGILNGTPITLHGSTAHPSSRCWIHAREVCNALLFLTDNARDGEAYNVVGEERTVLEIGQFISKVIGNPLSYQWLDFHATRPGHDLRYALHGGKLLSMGFHYKYPLEDSLDRMVRWMIRPENRRWL